MEQATVAQLVSGGGTLVFAWAVWQEVKELRAVQARMLLLLERMEVKELRAVQARMLLLLERMWGEWEGKPKPD